MDALEVIRLKTKIQATPFSAGALRDAGASLSSIKSTSTGSAPRHQLRGLFVPLSSAQLVASLFEQGRVEQARPSVENANTLFAAYFPREPQ